MLTEVGGSSGLGGGTFAKLLPLLAPLVLAFLARNRGGQGAGGGGGDAGLGGVFGDILGGGGGCGPGDLLGKGGLGDVLGGLLGGGRRD